MTEIQIGVLGAARILRGALLAPAQRVDGVTVAAIAARDPARARTYAAKHRIPRVHDSYEALLADPAIDAVYIPSPAALHARWTMAALDAGKHVLVEKPFTANAAEAERVAAAIATSDRVVMEAYHTGHHPLTARLREILASGEIGTVRAARAIFLVPVPPGRNIRWNPALGGGGLLDVGYYPVRLLRDLFGEATVERAHALHRNGIDRYLEADLTFPGDVRGTVVSSLWSRHLFGSSLRVDGDRGRLTVSWPYLPQFGSRITVRAGGRAHRERADRTPTYVYQLRAFRDAVLGDGPILTDAAAAVSQMRALDDIYVACGLRPRCLP
ncbi:Gfo/Idh/MocA family protein [Actinoplanes aureus]|uniref:Gfo/Idh/MocA family oxidoreductase n=1 Tax=Actinoplanes aureus TaxID=2792083 RepID=A0A931FW95_9ACTN|nr:Gfo/Idh/MocA family oxidoreductase [Actinoplanes aureus]MBG0561552.1 Gfo/Idh/MocA family oxidoreductase [Actinoplanes aureus]